MRLSHPGRIGRALAAVGAAAPLVLSAGSASAQGNASETTGTYTGRACAVLLQNVKLAVVAVPDTCLGDSGQLPAAGGTANGPTGPISVAGLITANVLVSSATGAVVPGSGPVSSASSQVAGVAIVPGVAGVTPDLADVTLLTAATSVNCTGIQTPTKTTVASVSVNGSTIDVTGAPNQVVPIPGVGTLTLNRQAYDAGSNTATGEAVVLDLNVLGVVTGHIALAHAESDLSNCSGGAATPNTGVSLPPTGSLPSGMQLTGSQRSGLGIILPVGATAVVAAGLAVAWRRRRELVHADGRDGS